jgi:hypothetical protein
MVRTNQGQQMNGQSSPGDNGSRIMTLQDRRYICSAPMLL